jgi:hypothetical protein
MYYLSTRYGGIGTDEYAITWISSVIIKEMEDVEEEGKCDDRRMMMKII